MRYKLRDNSTTSDQRLNRLVSFDERSKAFPVRGVISKAEQRKPRSRRWSISKVLDQGKEGACVGFAFSHDLIATPCPYPEIDDTFAKQTIYWEAQRIDEWEGGSYPDATPISEGTAVLAGVKVAQKLGYYREYRWAFGVDDLVLALGYVGPAVIGVNWYNGMYATESDGFISPSGGIEGGHAILVRGVDVKQQYFTLVNSWGKDWGTNGDCKLTYKAMARLLSEDGEACVPSRRRRIAT